MYVVTDISVYCYGRGMRPEADKHLAVPHKIVGATPMRMHLLLACEAGIVYSVKNKAYKQLESPHTADIIDIDAFDEQAVLCDERSLVSLWQTDEFGVMCTHTISCNAVKVVQCLHCVVVTEPNEIVSVWDVETQQCFVSWESPGISEVPIRRAGTSSVYVVTDMAIVEHTVRRSSWAYQWNKELLSWCTVPRGCTGTTRKSMTPIVRDTIQALTNIWGSSCWIHRPTVTPFKDWFKEATIREEFLQYMGDCLQSSWSSEREITCSIQWLSHILQDNVSLANRHEFLQGMHKKLEMHLIDHTVYQTNMAVTLKLLMVGYPPTWESIPIISWCCIHIRQRHIREMFTNLFRMYPKKCVLMAQVHPTTELFFTFPAAVLDEMIGKGWAAFILEGFLSKRVPLHRNSKKIFDMVCSVYASTNIFKEGLDCPLVGCGSWNAGETKDLTFSLKGKWIRIKTVLDTWCMTKVEEVQLQDPSNRKVVGRVYTPDEPEGSMTHTFEMKDVDWELWKSEAVTKWHTHLDIALALCSHDWSFPSRWIPCMSRPLPGDRVRSPPVSGIIRHMHGETAYLIGHSEPFHVDECAAEMCTEEISFEIRPVYKQVILDECRDALLEWGHLSPQHGLTFKSLEPCLFYEDARLLSEIEMDYNITATTASDTNIWIGCMNGDIEKHGLRTMNHYMTLRGHQARVRVLMIHADDLLVSGSEDRSVRVWHSGMCIHTLKQHTSAVVSLAEMSDDCVWSLGSNGMLCSWNTHRGELNEIITYSNAPESSLPGPWLAFADDEMQCLRRNAKRVTYPTEKPLSNVTPISSESVRVNVAAHLPITGWCMATDTHVRIADELIEYPNVSVMTEQRSGSYELVTGTTEGVVMLWQKRRPGITAHFFASSIEQIQHIPSTSMYWVWEACSSNACLISIHPNAASDAARLVRVLYKWSPRWQQMLRAKVKRVIQPICIRALSLGREEATTEALLTIEQFTEEYDYRKHWCTSKLFRMLQEHQSDSLFATKMMDRLVTYTGPRPVCAICCTADNNPFCKLKTCGHIYHRECIERYVACHPDFVEECQVEYALTPEMTCPQCRCKFPCHDYQELLSPASSIDTPRSR